MFTEAASNNWHYVDIQEAVNNLQTVKVNAEKRQRDTGNRSLGFLWNPFWLAFSEFKCIPFQKKDLDRVVGALKSLRFMAFCLTCMKLAFHCPIFFYFLLENSFIHLNEKLYKQTHKRTHPCVLDMTDNQNSLLEDGLICSLIPVLPKKDRWE